MVYEVLRSKPKKNKSKQNNFKKSHCSKCCVGSRMFSIYIYRILELLFIKVIYNLEPSI